MPRQRLTAKIPSKVGVYLVRVKKQSRKRGGGTRGKRQLVVIVSREKHVGVVE